MPTTAHYGRWITAAIAFKCLYLAKHYLIVPDRLHRWCMLGITSIIVMLIGCFITYAYVEKFNYTANFFYGHVKFSFIDGGYPEIFGYVLELAACLLFALYAAAQHKKHWYAWAGIMLVIFLDDAFKLHESIGILFSTTLELSAVIGDLAGFACTGLLSAILWFAGMRIVESEEEISSYFLFTAYFVLLTFFGVGIDAIHGTLGENMSQTIFTLVEDGGELITTAVITLSVLGMWCRQKIHP